MSTDSPSSAAEKIAGLYAERASEYGRQFETLAMRAGGYSYARGVLFLAAAVGLLFGWAQVSPPVLWWTLGGVLTAGFLLAVALHETTRRTMRRLADLVRINEESIARVERDWRRIPQVGAKATGAAALVADDLDLLGHASLFHLTCLARTPAGVALLRNWLLEPAAPDMIQQRQRAVQALAPGVDLREELHLRGRMLAASKAGPLAFIDWSESETWLERRPLLVWASRLIPLVAIVVIALALFGLASNEFAGFTALALLLATILISVLFTGRIHDIFDSIASTHGEVDQYRAMFRLAVDAPDDGGILAQLKHDILAPEHGADPRLQSLNRIMSLAGLRHSGLTGAFYLILQLALLWDFHVLWLLEIWQRRHGAHVRRWFAALAELEALSSLAGLAHDNPGWTFPEVERRETKMLRATELGHPLLSPRLRVCNDVEVGPPGTLLLVTGSNMSGKSTLLRSLGVNVALAQAGGPVCAASLTMTPLKLATSMRVQDSLEDGVSFYMAELKRLKRIVDQASELVGNDDWTLLYLLDEILLGTNSRERHIAVSRVLAHLLAQGAIGAVSTHDLELASVESLVAACRPVHFRESLHPGSGVTQMTFDYKMRPGIATTSNALKLLEMVGLDV